MSNPAPHALSVELEDRSGALARVVGMFARRGFNIETLAVRPSARAGVSDLALTVRCDDRALAQIEKQLMKLVNVLSVRAADLPSAPSPGGRTPPGRPLSERTAMATIHRHGNLDLLGGKVAVIGYGSQGHAHALNLHDSGVQVQVGLREGSASREAAEDAGLAVGSAAEATAGAQVVALLLPDHVQKDVYEREVRPNLAAGATLLFAHGFNIHFGRIEAPAGHDVVMVAPKAPGHRVRELYEAGAGTPALVAVHRDASGNALDLALAYGAGIGSARVGLLETTFAEETESDLFGEQAVLCGGVTELMRAGFETLVEAGYQPEIAYYECINELKLIVDLVYQGGFEYMRHSISDVAEYGDLSRGPTVVDGHVRENMRRVLDDICSGVFARELIADDDAGRPRFAELRGAARGGLLEEVGRDLRDLAGTEGLLGAEAQRA